MNDIDRLEGIVKRLQDMIDDTKNLASRFDKLAVEAHEQVTRMREATEAVIDETQR